MKTSRSEKMMLFRVFGLLRDGMVTKSEDIFGLEYTDSKNSLKIEVLSKFE